MLLLTVITRWWLSAISTTSLSKLDSAAVRELAKSACPMPTMRRQPHVHVPPPPLRHGQAAAAPTPAAAAAAAVGQRQQQPQQCLSVAGGGSASMGCRHGMPAAGMSSVIRYGRPDLRALIHAAAEEAAAAAAATAAVTATTTVNQQQQQQEEEEKGKEDGMVRGLFVCVCGPEGMVHETKEALKAVEAAYKKKKTNGSDQEGGGSSTVMIEFGLHCEEPDW
jgi:hypothetical protein